MTYETMQRAGCHAGLARARRKGWRGLLGRACTDAAWVPEGRLCRCPSPVIRFAMKTPNFAFPALALLTSLVVSGTASADDGPGLVCNVVVLEHGSKPSPSEIAAQKTHDHCKTGDVLDVLLVFGQVRSLPVELCDFSKQILFAPDGNLLQCIYAGKREYRKYE